MVTFLFWVLHDFNTFRQFFERDTIYHANALRSPYTHTRDVMNIDADIYVEITWGQSEIRAV